MLRKLPPLEAAEAFAVAARSPSFRAAARELALSPSALSRRIQSLEQFLGQNLFDRSAQGVVLTATGRAYLAEAGPALDRLAAATARLHDTEHTLRLAASHSFMAEWLLPRLGRLMAETGITIEPLVGDTLRITKAGGADVSILGAVAPPPGADARPLADGAAILVGACELAGGRSSPRSLSEIRDVDRLGERSARQIWLDWSDRVGAGEPLPPTRTFETMQLAYESAANGFGVTLAVPLLAERFLQSGRLKPCLPHAAPIDSRYWLINARRDHAVADSALARVTSWIMEEAGASVRRFHEVARA